MPHDPQHPTGFIGGGTYRPPATPPATPLAAYLALAFVPPPPPMPTLAIRLVKQRYYALTLHKPLVDALGLSYGRPINLLPPAYGSLVWHLDLRPEAPCQVKWYEDTSVRVDGIKLPPGLVASTLVLHLLPGEPRYPHVYPMLPENAFLTQSPR